MASRLNYYFRQKVSESELDDGFELLEQADRDFVTDLQLVGVVTGHVVTQRGAGPNLTVDVSAGKTYDKNGQRISTTAVQNVNVAVDESAVNTAVSGVGNSKILSVFAKFIRVLTDPRTDGNSMTVYFSEAESFQFIVRQGVEAPSPSAPALDPEYILLADITRTFGDTQIVNAVISITRREDTYVRTGATYNLRLGRIKDVFNEIYDHLNTEAANFNAHLTDATDAHDASAISYVPSNTWADASPLAATEVQAALEEIIGDLGATTGAAKIGAAGSAASFMFGLTAGSVASQLTEVKAYLDAGPNGRRVHSVAVGDSPVSLVVGTHHQILVDTGGGQVSLNLPAPAHGVEFFVKDKEGTFGTNKCILVRNGSEEIEDVAANRDLQADFGYYRVWSDGTDWYLG